jgi:molecular chaperone GrpE
MSTESRESQSAGAVPGEEPTPIRVTDRRRVTEETPLEEGLDEAGAGGSTDAASTEGDELVEDPPGDGAGVIDDPVELRFQLIETEARLAEADRQVQEMSVRFRSAQAQLRVEADEQRARLQRTFDQKLDGARAELVASLLETLDNLKRAIQAAETTESAAGAHSVDPRFAPFLGGVRATAQLFESKMQSLGLTPVPAVGQAFDPELHEAVEIVPVPPELDNQVTFEYQTGYRLGERLLRPARVRVGRA